MAGKSFKHGSMGDRWKKTPKPKGKDDSPAVVVCCGCWKEIKPSQVADCPNCKKLGKDWNKGS